MTESDLSRNHKSGLEEIALYLDFQDNPKNIDAFKNLNTITLNFWPWIVGKNFFKYEYKFKKGHQPNWLEVDILPNNSLQINTTKELPYELTTLYQFEMLTTFRNRHYVDHVKLNLQKWNVQNWIDCGIDIYNNAWDVCIKGYNPVDAEGEYRDECIKAYDAGFEEIIYKLLLMISISITVGFMILIIIRDQIFMLVVIYLENFILSMAFIIYFVYFIGFSSHDPYLLLIGKDKKYGFGYFLIALPFWPLSSLILHILMLIIGMLDTENLPLIVSFFYKNLLYHKSNISLNFNTTNEFYNTTLKSWIYSDTIFKFDEINKFVIKISFLVCILN